ncbi:MAG: ATP synthase F1 subunit delta [Candidatus Omnitrophota bacterium]
MNLRSQARYAKALYGLAEDQNVIEPVRGLLRTLGEAVARDPGVLRFLTNIAIAPGEKNAVLGHVFGPEAPALFRDFLRLLVRRNRIGELAVISKEFEALYAKAHRLLHVEAVTAVPLSAANRDKLQTVLKKHLGTGVRVKETVNRHILAGMILRSGDFELNGSYQRRFRDLAASLSE